MENKTLTLLYPVAYFSPEKTASSHLEDDRFKAFIDKAIRTTVITPSPCRGLSCDEIKNYKNRRVELLYNDTVSVHRVRLFREARNPVARAIRYMLMEVKEYFEGAKHCEADMIVCGSTPPTHSVMCAFLKKKLSKKSDKVMPLVYILQDIFPDSLVNTGLTRKDSLIWKLGRKIEIFAYNHADKIIVISEGFKRNIIAKGVPEKKITVIPNWVDLDDVKPVERANNPLFDEFSIDRSKFIVVYAGNMGEMQGADIIIDAAKELNFDNNIQFVIFGGGSRYKEIRERIETEKLANVFITDLQPQERVPYVYSMGDIALITCKPGTGSAGMPSKIWSIMACNTPIIASFDTDSDLADVIRESGAGCCVEPGNSRVLADAIIEWFNSTKDRVFNVANLRDYVNSKASKDVCTQKYIDVFQEINAAE